MTEVCINGHTRTEENTRWHKRGRGEQRKRVCLDCRREKRTSPTTGPTASEVAAQRTTELHEDIEDLLRFGATFTEIIARGGFSSWASLRASLKRRGRDDLLDAMQRKIAASPNAKLSKPFTRSTVCGRRGCGRKRYFGKRCKKHYHEEWLGHGRPCKIQGCDTKQHAKDYCDKHYKQQWRKGKLENTGD